MQGKSRITSYVALRMRSLVRQLYDGWAVHIRRKSMHGLSVHVRVRARVGKWVLNFFSALKSDRHSLVLLALLEPGLLRGVKAWVRFFRARTEIAYARRLRFCGFRNNHMTSNTSFGCVLAYFCLYKQKADQYRTYDE